MWPLQTKGPSLAEQVEKSILLTTHGRIRDLAVEEVQGKFVVKGRVPTYHTKQLAFWAALQLIPSERFDAQITVA
jgi:hypothetical protein